MLVMVMSCSRSFVHSLHFPKSQKLCSSMEITSLHETSQYHKLVFATALDFCNNGKSNGKLPKAFCGGKQGDANCSTPSLQHSISGTNECFMGALLESNNR